jgi:tRNA-binding protein
MEQITFTDFLKVELRIGTIIAAEPFPEAKRPAIKMTIDFGPLGTKKSSAQITGHYTPDKIIGRQVLAVVNFPPKQIANFMSECLVTGVHDAAEQVVLLAPDMKVPNGTKLL